MEFCPKGLSTISQLFSESVSDGKTGGCHIFSRSAQRTEVICPEPRRANSVSFMLDGLNRFGCCNPRSLNMCGGDIDFDILDILTGKDALDFDSDICSPAGFFQGSPPARTSNPVVRDVMFVKQSIATSSPLGSNNHGGKPNSPIWLERRATSCGSSFDGSPKVRVEGFNSSNSGSSCVVAARA